MSASDSLRTFVPALSCRNVVSVCARKLSVLRDAFASQASYARTGQGLFVSGLPPTLANEQAKQACCCHHLCRGMHCRYVGFLPVAAVLLVAFVIELVTVRVTLSTGC